MLAAVVVVIVIYALYVSVIMKKNKIREASAGIDVQLKKRYDLIPNLLKMANKFMEHERGLMEEITKLRTEAMSKKFNEAPADSTRFFSQENSVEFF